MFCRFGYAIYRTCKIEDEVIIAAGSTVSVNVEKGALFINRAGHKMIKDYYYKKFQK